MNLAFSLSSFLGIGLDLIFDYEWELAGVLVRMDMAFTRYTRITASISPLGQGGMLRIFGDKPLSFRISHACWDLALLPESYIGIPLPIRVMPE